MEQLVFKLETCAYEGPLDLILDLISKNKMNIFDIKISIIFDQYMDYLRQMEEINMEVAGEFLTMASKLMLIKSKMLLPKVEEEDPRQELVEQLMEYSLAKEAAKMLGARELEFKGRYEKETDDIKPDKTIIGNLELSLLEKAMNKLFLRLKEEEEEEKDNQKKIAPLIKRKMVPVQGRIIHVLRYMAKKPTAHIDELFAEVKSRSELVAMFYAILELVKVGRLVPERAATDETGEDVIFKLNREKLKDKKEVEDIDGN